MWAKMQSHTPEAHHLISSMTFKHTQYEDLLRLLVKNQLDNTIPSEQVQFYITSFRYSQTPLIRTIASMENSFGLFYIHRNY